MIKHKYFLTLLLIIIVSTFFKLSFVSKFYTEIDDLISISQIINYKDKSIYSLANDELSPNYNNNIKKKIREIQSKNNKYFDLIEKISSNILIRATPSKHSTYAPMQYLLFSDLINRDQNYEELKFYSRIPSIFFAILYVLITYFFCTKIFEKESKFSLLASCILILSMPLIYISLRSYNYSAGVLTTTFIFLLTYLEMIDQNFSQIKLSNEKINFKKSILLGGIFSFLAYLNYSVFFILPIFFIICFLKYFNFQLKKIISNINYNLFLIGVSFIFFSLPLIIHIFNMNLHQYGVTSSTAGQFMEFSLDANKKNSFLYVVLFYLKNYYLIISKNISFFTDNFLFSDFLQFILFLFVLVGMFVSRNENLKFKMFSNLIIFFIIYYFLLVYFEILTLGPTRHSSFYVPMYIISFVIAIRFILKFIKKKFQNLIYNFLIITLFSVFIISAKDFYKYYSDPFDEKFIKQVIKKYNVGYISSDPSGSNGLCFMQNLNVLIRTCPYKYYRFQKFINLDEIDLKEFKRTNKAIMFVNNQSSLSKNIKLLDDEKFVLVEKIDKSRFDLGNSPLFVSQYVPNRFKIYVYK